MLDDALNLTARALTSSMIRARDREILMRKSLYSEMAKRGDHMPYKPPPPLTKAQQELADEKAAKDTEKNIQDKKNAA